MDDCIFCKIANGQIPCQKIHENENFLAFLTIEPFTEGHTLVIPKSHHRWVYEVPDFGKYWEFTQKTTQIIQKTLKPFFVSYLTMGNEIPHAHIHIIPRYQGDKLVGIFENLNTHPSTEELEIIANKIKK